MLTPRGMAPYHVMLLAILLFGWSLLNGYEGAEAGALDLNGSSKAGNSHPPMNSHSSVLPLPDDGPRYTVSASDPGMALFQRGVTAYNQRNPAAADTVFHEFIRTFPQSPLVEAASAFLAELLLTDPQDVQQRLAAIDAYRAVVRRFPGSANATRAAWRIGDLYAEHGWWLEAQSAYTRADGDARQSGDADRARLGLGLALSAAKRWTDAIRVLDELAARHQDDQLTPYAVVGLADALFGAKRTAEAKALYESSFTRWTDFFKQHPDSLHRYADAALLAQDDTMVRQAYLLLYNLHPQHAAVPFGLVSIGDGFRRSDRWERAHFFYATAVAQYPNTAAATVARLRLADLGLQIDAGPRDERIAPMIREAIHYAPAVIFDLKGQERAFRDIADANAATAIGSEAGFRLGEHFERAQKWAEAI
ncbi:MAG TPA: tetratricopeptide repeat protein, partial [Nitrospiraceae bacterium]|nr:tetratricopeptide repeat protein [Nitrospiraceae bacterium]